MEGIKETRPASLAAVARKVARDGEGLHPPETGASVAGLQVDAGRRPGHEKKACVAQTTPWHFRDVQIVGAEGSASSVFFASAVA